MSRRALILRSMSRPISYAGLLPESIHRRRLYVCAGCGFVVTDQLVQLTRQRHCGLDLIVLFLRCNTRIPLLDREERLPGVPVSRLIEMDHAADRQRERSASASMLQGKIATADFDVFLCHHAVDKPAVKQVGERLKDRGILPWLDEWELRPGLPWQRLLRRANRADQNRRGFCRQGRDWTLAAAGTRCLPA